MLRQIIRYAESGWKLVPVKAGTKNAGSLVGAGWDKQATSDPVQLTKWWTQWPDAWPAVLLGEASGIIDVEADTPEANAEADAMFHWSDRQGWYTSPRSVHRLFRWTPELGAIGKAVVKVNGIEFRIGGNGKACCSILPPAGGREWIRPADWSPTISLPASVLAVLTGAGKVAANLTGDPAVEVLFNGPSAAGAGSGRGEAPKPVLAGVGERNDKLASLVGGWCKHAEVLGQREVKEIRLKALAANSAFDPPLETGEVDAVVNSIVSREQAARSAGREDATDRSKTALRKAEAAAIVQAAEMRLTIVLSEPRTYELESGLWAGVVKVDAASKLLSFPAVRIAVYDQTDCLLPAGKWDKLWAHVVDSLNAAATSRAVSPDEKQGVRFAVTVYDAVTSPELVTVLETGERVIMLNRVQDRYPMIRLQDVGAVLRSCGFRCVRMRLGAAQKRCWLIDDISLARLAEVAELNPEV